MTSPVSMPSSRKARETPVRRCPSINARWMGAAPRNWGSRLGWTLSIPRGKRRMKGGGRILPNAATTPRSAPPGGPEAHSPPAETSSQSATSQPGTARAASFRGVMRDLRPRPAGRSLRETTPARAVPALAQALEEPHRKPGAAQKDYPQCHLPRLSRAVPRRASSWPARGSPAWPAPAGGRPRDGPPRGGRAWPAGPPPGPASSPPTGR